MPQECTICKIIKDESEFSCLNRDNGVQLAKSCRECNSKTMKKKEGLGVNISTFVDQGRW